MSERITFGDVIDFVGSIAVLLMLALGIGFLIGMPFADPHLLGLGNWVYLITEPIGLWLVWLMIRDRK